MTEKRKVLVEQSKLTTPSKFQSGDIVARLETSEDTSVDSCYHLYKIAEVPLGHNDAGSRSDKIKCQWFKPVTTEEQSEM